MNADSDAKLDIELVLTYFFLRVCLKINVKFDLWKIRIMLEIV